MAEKRVLCPERLRQVPRQFSWVDQRLVRDRYVERCSLPAWGLYLFLLIVGDAKGLSYYSDDRICRDLSISGDELRRLRAELEGAEVIVYRRPLYQVLSLERQAPPRVGQTVPIAEVLRSIVQGVRR